jgi:hypothetical protein
LCAGDIVFWFFCGAKKRKRAQTRADLKKCAVRSRGLIMIHCSYGGGCALRTPIAGFWQQPQRIFPKQPETASPIDRRFFFDGSQKNPFWVRTGANLPI